jgi:hypothetical protein
MNQIRWIALTAGLAVTCLGGCSRPTEPVQTPSTPPTAQPVKPAPTTVPTEPVKETTSLARPTIKAAGDQFDKLVASFSTANPNTLAAVQQAVTAIRSGKYSDAMPLLQKALGDAHLTAEQQSLLKQTIETVKGYVAKQMTTDPVKAVSDVPKSLPIGK